MASVEHLQLICVTYNRRDCLAETFRQLLAEESPVRDCDFLVLDNASTDGTAELIRETMRLHPNVRTIRHRHNIGGNANIARAIELADRDYLWLLGDDDYYDFAGWGEVEQAMARGERSICLSRYLVPDEHRDDVAWQLVQATFITGMINHTSLFSDTAVTEVHNHIHTLFPQIIPVMHHVNAGGSIFVVDRPVAFNGDDGKREGSKDLAFTRGARVLDVSPYTRSMQWIYGWAMVCAVLKDDAVRERTFRRGLEFVYGSPENAYHELENLRIQWSSDSAVPLLAYVAVTVPAEMQAEFFKLIRHRDGGGLRRWRCPEDEDTLTWYRRSGINEQPIRRVLFVFAWHLFKIVNPFSSLHRKRRADGRKRRTLEECQ